MGPCWEQPPPRPEAAWGPTRWGPPASPREPTCGLDFASFQAGTLWSGRGGWGVLGHSQSHLPPREAPFSASPWSPSLALVNKGPRGRGLATWLLHQVLEIKGQRGRPCHPGGETRPCGGRQVAWS